MDVPDLHGVLAHQPLNSIQVGTQWYHGYAARYLNSNASICTKHKKEIDSMRSRSNHSEDSHTSSAVGEIAGLTYGLALSCAC